MTGDRIARFRRWFWRPPRAQGEVIHDRSVGFLELYYDLVYVAVIIQLAHRLAHELTFEGLAQFSIVFALVFIAWVNGSLYLELHGHEDGRTRIIVFGQIVLLALIAAFIADAGTDSGRPFALAYGAFIALSAWCWRDARSEDRSDRPDAVEPLRRYVMLLAISSAVLVAATVLPGAPRLAIGAAFALVWVAGIWAAGRRPMSLARVIVPTEALVERFGLLVIIVLGEVFFGVVNGLAATDRDALTIVTAMVALLLGFGFGWIYFDLIGRRLPRGEGPPIARWLLGHLPMTLAIAVTGAAGVSLVEHAHDAATPDGTAWALSSSVAVALLALVAIKDTLQDAARLPSVYGPVGVAGIAGAAAALIVGWLRPAPWVLAALLVVIVAVIWLFTVGRFMTVEDADRGGAVGSGSD